MEISCLKFAIIFSLSTMITVSKAQIRGKITNIDNEPVSGATITVESTPLATASNADGNFEIKNIRDGKYKITVYNMGYQTQSKNITVDKEPISVNFILEETTQNIEEVVVRNKENPANRIIKNAIKARQENSEKHNNFSVDFYSKGIVEVKNLPEKMLGIDLSEDSSFADRMILDSTRSGIVYLSETVSQLNFKKPNKFKEIIKASKISGNDRGYSFNTAMGANFDFYTNTLNFPGGPISPISEFAFSYYSYRLVQKFESGDSPIYKIQVIPKRKQEPVFDGFIYIIDQSWEIFATDLNINGKAINQPIIDTISIRQQYAYDSLDKRWSKHSQRINMKIGFMNLNFAGQFDHIFSGYHYFGKNSNPQLEGSTLVKIEEKSNRLDSNYWSAIRPILLKQKEVINYEQMDSIQKIVKSPAYIDSVDRKNNKFTLPKLIGGHEYVDSKQNLKVGYRFASDVRNFSFNAVQGFVLPLTFYVKKESDENLARTNVSTHFSYGFSDQNLRYEFELDHKFKTRHPRTIRVALGDRAVQFNPNEPISPFFNSISSLFFKENFIKLYQNRFAKIGYTQTFIPGLKASITTSLERRSPLFTNTNYSFFDKKETYASNDPIDETNYSEARFTTHTMAKFGATVTINPYQKIMDRPDGIVYIDHPKMPTINVSFEKGFHDTNGFSKVSSSIEQQWRFNNKGTLDYKVSGGKFFKSDDLYFIDYKHFNGNQTHVATGSKYLDNFLIMPYYTMSTDNRYLEGHIEHNFKGFLLNKIPGINRLGLNLIVGYHLATTSDMRPYHEFTAGIDNLGWGKLRIFRLDYVNSLQSNSLREGIVFGIKVFRF